MIPGFVKVDRHVFFGQIWDKIKAQVDAVQSNLKRVSAGEDTVLVVHWGYKIPDTEEKVILAVSRSGGGVPEEHWVEPSLLNP